MVVRSSSSLQHCSASPQVLVAEDGQLVAVWPENWGITVSQVRSFLDKCRGDPRWRPENTMRDLVEQYIKPLTAGTGLGYALNVNRRSPKQVQIMMSHSWNENVEDFVETLQRTVSDHEPLFICSLCLFQNCDGSGPTIADQLGSEAHDSPFCRVLRAIAITGKLAGWRWQPNRNVRILGVLLLTLATCGHFIVAHLGSPLDFCPHGAHATLTASVCLYPNGDIEKRPLGTRMVIVHSVALVLFLLFLLTAVVDSRARFYYGRMVAVPNREDKLYSRLWCVYEMFVASSLGVHVELAHSFADVGSSTCHEASCSCEGDRKHICTEIESWGEKLYGSAEQGYNHVDSCISALTNRAKVNYFIAAFCLLSMWIASRLFTLHEDVSDKIVTFVLGFCPLVGQLGLLFKLLKRSAGHMSWSGYCVLVGPALIISIVCNILGCNLAGHGFVGEAASALGHNMAIILIFTMVLLTAVHLTPQRARYGAGQVVTFWVMSLVLVVVNYCVVGIVWAPYLYAGLTTPYLPVLLLDYSPMPLAISCWWLWLMSWGAKTPGCHMRFGFKSAARTSNSSATDADVRPRKEMTSPAQLPSESPSGVTLDVLSERSCVPAPAESPTDVTRDVLSERITISSPSENPPDVALEVLLEGSAVPANAGITSL